MDGAMLHTYEVTDATMLFKFCSGKLPHVSPRTFFGNAGGAAHNLSPKGQRTLSLNELMEQ
jgi:hypothetical protein